jgi:FkbM family methyltransferase
MTDDEQDALFLSAGTHDEYRFAKIGFEPDVIYDIGADCGSVTLHLHRLFPQSRIVAVEPNPWSFPRLAKNAAGIPQIAPVNAAVGQGPLFEPRGPVGPLHWLVVDQNSPTWDEKLIPATVPAVGLDELYAAHGGDRYAVKVDCEGGEVAMMRHEPSRQVLLGSAYFAAELHYWGSTREGMMAGVDTISRFLFELAQTHTIYTYSYGACGHVWAKRRVPQNHVEAWLG